MENRRKKVQPQTDIEEKVIAINRVTKVTKGGRRYSFTAVVAVGNKKGKVGLGYGKANEIQDAIKKALKKANKDIITIPLIDGRTIPHETVGVSGASRVLIKPAKEGTGVIAGGPVRAVLELAGVKDIVSKSLGSSTKLNIAKATMMALESQKTVEETALLRGKKVEELFE